MRRFNEYDESQLIEAGEAGWRTGSSAGSGVGAGLDDAGSGDN